LWISKFWGLDYVQKLDIGDGTTCMLTFSKLLGQTVVVWWQKEIKTYLATKCQHNLNHFGMADPSYDV